MISITIISLLFIGILAFMADKLTTKLQLPGLLGMMIVGMVIGPYMLNLVPTGAMAFSTTFRDAALVTVLFIGGLGISKEDLKKIGRPAIFLSILPATLEGFTIAVVATWLLDFTFVQGAILGFIIAAVSPAILIPGMNNLITQKRGTKKGIPQMLLVGASADDAVAITLFTSFIMMYFGNGTASFGQNLLQIPLSLVISLLVAFLIFKVFQPFFKKLKSEWAATLLAFVLCLILRFIENHWHFSLYNSLLTIVAFGYFIRNHLHFNRSQMTQIWNIGRLYLFIFVGMLINPKLIGGYAAVGLLILTISLTIRCLGVFISLIGTDLSLKERIFCMIAYVPKATVQAAKSPIPRSMGIEGGEIMEALAILTILVTAPIGAIGIKIFSKWLQVES